MNLNLALLFPEWIAIAFLIIMVLAEIFRKRVATSLTTLAMIGSGSVFLSALAMAGKNGAAFGGMFILDSFAVFFKSFFAAVAFVIVMMSRIFFKDRAEKSGEFILILWSSLIGLFFLVSANDFLLLFVALEIFTLSLYIMAAYLKRDLLSIESGLKYLILGSLASAFLIYGISLVYVASGSTAFPEVRQFFTAEPHNQLLLLGILFILSGLGFKIASVPFQLWVPDVYEGALTPVVAYLAVASKAAGFALLLRVFSFVFVSFGAQHPILFPALAAMTLLYGNLGALVQTNIKRLFGYSGIGHAGYLLIGIAVGGKAGATALLYYLIAYAVTNLAAFFVITLAESEIKSDQIHAYRGLAKRSPFLAGILFVALLSLAGVPPLAGFFGKFLVLLGAVRGGLAWLALLGVLGVAVSLYYYLSVVRAMYMDPAGDESVIRLNLSSKLLLVFLTAGIFLVGVWQTPFFYFSEFAVRSLF